ncbi:MAG: ABC transporter permease subunit [Erysipelotrichales bacterium]|nr:ABC transporter permease subunit [Erysipelotrichales bacterium]
MKKETWISLIILLITWSLLAAYIDNDIFLPTVSSVVLRIINEMGQGSFYITLLTTLLRTTVSFGVSFLLGVSLGILSGMYKLLYRFLSPIVVVLKTIPNISYMFLLLLWVSKVSTAVYYIGFFIVFPLFFDSAYNAVNQMDRDLKDVILLYDESFSTKLTKIYIPECMHAIKGVMISCISLSFKVCIMSEVLGFVKIGIGREMYFDKANLDLTGVFAWTIIVILLVFLLEQVVNLIFKKFEN